MNNSAFAISPLDGRYQHLTTPLANVFSEFALSKFRIMVEVKWLQALANNPEIKEFDAFTKQEKTILDKLITDFAQDDFLTIKKIEQQTNHDIKAIEYYLRDKIAVHPNLANTQNFIHFACTSEDINNLAYGLMLKHAETNVLFPTIEKIIDSITSFAKKYAKQPMLARTHGQPASPTTLGKEFINFALRLKNVYGQIKNISIMGKFNGAVGNFNAFCAAYPKANWLKISKDFVESLGLTWNSHTTQIEPHDTMAELFQGFVRVNNILLDFCRDVWGYIALEYLSQKPIVNEVSSSVMPHKINPIDFENAEGNLGLANALFSHFALKLPISRFQRDLSDSTVMRNIGVAFAHNLVAFESILKGLSKLVPNTVKLTTDLNQNWQILTEAIQTVMRRYNLPHAYEELKQLARGKIITKEDLHKFIDTLKLPTQAKLFLKNLTPENYLGLAIKLVEE